MPGIARKAKYDTVDKEIALAAVDSAPIVCHHVAFRQVGMGILRIDESNQPVYGCESDPRHPDSDNDYEHYIEPSFKHRIHVLATECGYDLWEDPRWREHVKAYVPCAELGDETIPWDKKESTDEEWDDFKAVFEDGAYDAYICKYTYSDVSAESYREHHALRLLYTFLLEHKLDNMEKLLDLDYAHVGRKLFPYNRYVNNGQGFKTYSLLGMAFFEVRSVRAVRMLLARGADPNDCLVSFEEQGGAGAFGRPITLCIEYMDKQSDRAKQRWRNVLALVQLLAFWRRLAASPDSKAAARGAKRFQAAVTVE